MRTEFRRAIWQTELRKLVAFDKKVFTTDLFDVDTWKKNRAFWMLVDGVAVGCCAFEHHLDFAEDLGGVNLRRKGTLYISTTGILPRYQGLGLGTVFKAWEICYARRHGFERIVTNIRRSNKRMIRLNRKFGFRTIRTTADYYKEPNDAAVVMELQLSLPAKP